ncbi:MAG: hypothetical protein ABIH11_03810 [Candidatus Altiarchaeota archaeon]
MDLDIKTFFTALLLALVATTVSSQAISIMPPCCNGCSCSMQRDCELCFTCFWGTTGCAPVQDNAYDCCRDCSCKSPGECMECTNCCVDYMTSECYTAPCETTTSSTTTSTMRQTTTLREQTTTTTLEAIVRTTTTTSTTFFSYPKAEDLVGDSTTTTTTSYTTTTSTTTSTVRITSTTTLPTTTTTVMPEPNCFDGVKNQEEEWVDCGGPCDECGRPEVHVELGNPLESGKGESVKVGVNVSSNESGLYNVKLLLPDGFEADIKSMEVQLTQGGESELEFNIWVSEGVEVGDYVLKADVLDYRSLYAGGNQSNISVRDYIVISTPFISIRMPRSLGELQEKAFNFLHNKSRIIYSSRWFWALMLLLLAGLAYIYHMYERA